MKNSGSSIPTGLTVLAVALCLAAASPLAAEVVVKLRPDGTRVMVNTDSAPSRSSAAGSSGPTLAQRQAAARRYQRYLATRAHYQELIDRYSAQHSVDPKLVRSVIEVESAFRPMARSHKGAMGLMQLMPQTAAELAVSDPYDPEQNVRGGVTYLKAQLERFDGRVELALAAYNAGPTAVERYDGIPPYRETRDYVEKVLSLYEGRRVALPASPSVRRGRKPFIVKTADGRRVLTTEPSG